MPDLIGLGIIGCGVHGRGNLIPAIQRHPDARIVACVDADESRAQKAAADCGLEHHYVDHNRMLQEHSLDAVVIAVPHMKMLQVTLECIRAGVHLFLEKPMALNAADAQTVVDAAQQRQVKIMVGYCERYMGPRIMMKELLAESVVGDIDLVIAGKGIGPLGGWLAKPPAQGGGMLLFLGVHITDQILWMLDDYPYQVGAEVQFGTNGDDETSNTSMRFPKDILVSLNMSNRMGSGMTTGIDFIEIIGSEGRIRADWRPNILHVRSNVVKAYQNPTTIRVDEPDSTFYAAEMAAFVEALKTGSNMPIPGEDGVKVLQVIDAIFESNRLKRSVNPERLPVV